MHQHGRTWINFYRACCSCGAKGKPDQHTRHIRAGLEAGLYPQAAGRDEEWVSERLIHHRHPSAPVAMERQGGRWIVLTEQRLPHVSTAAVSTDITAQKNSERILSEQHEVLNTALKTIPDGVQVNDEDLRLLAYNEQFFTVFDLNAHEILQCEEPGWAFHRILAQRGEYGDVDALIARRRAIVSSKTKIFCEWQIESGKWVECRENPVEGGGYLLVYRGVSEHKQLMTKLEDLASIDALTGALNRRKFLQVAKAEH
ncbi:MAG: PAS domain-containing protein [Gammaproteobacteria bacterium]|jgi:PAS domain-containing protein